MCNCLGILYVPAYSGDSNVRQRTKATYFSLHVEAPFSLVMIYKCTISTVKLFYNLGYELNIPLYTENCYDVIAFSSGL